MSGGAVRQTVVIRDPRGFHLRPKGEVAKTALHLQCEVRLHWNGQTFNGKSMLDLLALAAEQGQEVIVEADGPGASEALPALVAALRRFEGEADADQVPPQLHNS